MVTINMWWWLPLSPIICCHGYCGPHMTVAMATMVSPSSIAMAMRFPPIIYCHGYHDPHMPVAMVTIATHAHCHGYHGHTTSVATVTMVCSPPPPISCCPGSPCVAMVTMVPRHLLPWLPKYTFVAVVTPSHTGCHGYHGPISILPWLLWVPMCLLPWLPHHTPVSLVAMVTVAPHSCCPWLPFPPITRCHGYCGHSFHIAMVTMFCMCTLPWLLHHSPVAMVTVVSIHPFSQLLG